ncbi:PIN-like domain-containing protein [Nocardia sp. NPDC058705]|uniref:PIN-like domain-containing protein n=1 Tax=Nocardia sp. NPDC058705 TaxID=3346609 RepID=UPI00367DA306
MSIYEGFEGYRDPTEPEVLALLASAPVVVDTNVLLDIYSFEESARRLALDVLESLRDRLWVPHQVMREFWRNRHSVIADISPPASPIGAVRNELLAIVNSLRPDRERPQDIQSIRDMIERQLGELSDAIGKARGAPLEITKILDDTSADPVLTRLSVILDNRIGKSLGDDEEDMIGQGLERSKRSIPPGYMDVRDKADQLQERGTGDFLLWEQTLRHVSGLSSCEAFILVTNDVKEDWRIVLKKPSKRTLGVRPELVAEAIERTGARLVLLTQSDFYRLMAKTRLGDEEASESLVAASTRLPDIGSDGVGNWNLAAYERLLSDLRTGGYELQADVILLAAGSGGFVARAVIYERAGFSEERSLRRFSLPAQRIALTLVDEGLIGDDAAHPLVAVFEGPGRAIGYRVPGEFVELEQER